MKYIASVSFGKDSLAMLLIILNNLEKYPLDEVVFYDTGVEFQAIYDARDKIIPLLKHKNIKFIVLKPKEKFIKKMINYPHLSRNGVLKEGYGWCGGLCRWGTTEKVRTIDNYCKNNHQYIGIALDETKRLERLIDNKSSPLANENLTEKDALKICYDNGFYYEENGVRLYDILDRVSCWCCRNKNLKELKNYKKYLPEYFNKLCILESIIKEPMKKPYFLEERFKEINMKNDFKNYILDSFDDNILALENKIGFERNYAIYLDQEGRKEEANQHWQEYYKAKKEITNYKRKIHRERNK